MISNYRDMRERCSQRDTLLQSAKAATGASSNGFNAAGFQVFDSTVAKVSKSVSSTLKRLVLEFTSREDSIASR